MHKLKDENYYRTVIVRERSSELKTAKLDKLYTIDGKIRKETNDILEHIELRFKKEIVDMFTNNNISVWDSKNFKNMYHYNNFKTKLEKDIKKSHEKFIADIFDINLKNYNLISIDKAIELLTFGDVYFLLNNMNDKYVKCVSKNYGYKNFNHFLSNMYSVYILRNMCAHHSILINKQFTIKPTIKADDLCLLDEKKSSSGVQPIYKLNALLLAIKYLSTRRYWNKYGSKMFLLLFKLNKGELKNYGLTHQRIYQILLK